MEQISGAQDKVAMLRLLGVPPQWLFVGSLIYESTRDQATDTLPAPYVVGVICSLGFGLMLWCGIEIYVPMLTPKKTYKLLTDGPFRYTRHPMYTGILLTAVYVWWPVEEVFSFGWLVSLGTFCLGLSAAAYLQEKETLAQFGNEAKEYYEKTPRIIIFWPYVWWKQRKSDTVPRDP